MKVLLTIFLKIPGHVLEVTFVLMVLLFVLKVVQSGVHHTCGGGHGYCAPTVSSRVLNFLPNFQKGGLDQTSIFRGSLLGKRRVTFFRGITLFT